MRAVMVSDAHLTGPDDPSQRALVAWLGALEADRLYLLGDLFHFWWGFEGAVMTRYVPVCAALMSLKRRGVSIHMVPGNHDFATGPFFTEALGASVDEQVSVELGGRRYLLAHGDEADRRLGYRLTRRLLRGRGFAGVMRALGPGRGGELLERLAGASREHMGDVAPLVAMQQTWARAQMRERGAEVVVMGHIHWPEVVAVDEGIVVHLGAWLGHRTFLVVEDGAAVLRRWRGGDWLGAVVAG